MPARPRTYSMNPLEIQIHHLWSRCLAGAFLLGYDARTDTDYSHRKKWLDSLLEFLVSVFGIDVGTYNWLSNHFHLTARSRPDIVATWTDEEVAWRWKMCWPELVSDKWVREPTDKQIDEILRRNVENPGYIDQLRVNLSDISHFMARLKEPIAKMANRETNRRGHYWDGRYGNRRLDTEGDVVGTFLYNDLQKVKAGMVDAVEQSEFSAIQRQYESMAHEGFEDMFGRSAQTEEDQKHIESLTRLFSNCFLAPITDEGPLMTERETTVPSNELVYPIGYHTAPSSAAQNGSVEQEAAETAAVQASEASEEVAINAEASVAIAHDISEVNVPANEEHSAESTAAESSSTEAPTTVPVDGQQAATTEVSQTDVAATTRPATRAEKRTEEAAECTTDFAVEQRAEAEVASNVVSNGAPGDRPGGSSGDSSGGEVQNNSPSPSNSGTPIDKNSKTIHERLRRRQRRRPSRNSMLCMPWRIYAKLLKRAEEKITKERAAELQAQVQDPLMPSGVGAAAPDATTASWLRRARAFVRELQAWAAELPEELAKWILSDVPLDAPRDAPDAVG